MMETLVAYHGKESEKTAILRQLKAHHDADEIVKGQYWENGRGCAVGCTVHGSDHSLYEPMFGIPQALARLEDTIFEGLPNELAKAWPQRFMQAIAPGSDLSLVQWAFLHRILTDEAITPGINHPTVKKAIDDVARLLLAWSKGDPIDASAARSAASAAESAAESAAWSAAEWSAACTLMSDVLIDLLQAAPMAGVVGASPNGSVGKGCVNVGCERPMPHDHDGGGPTQEATI